MYEYSTLKYTYISQCIVNMLTFFDKPIKKNEYSIQTTVYLQDGWFDEMCSKNAFQTWHDHVYLDTFLKGSELTGIFQIFCKGT